MMNRDMLIKEVMQAREQQIKPQIIYDEYKRVEPDKYNVMAYAAVFILGLCTALMWQTYNNVDYQSRHTCVPITADRG